jgi:enterochelin esterase-like enzyme
MIALVLLAGLLALQVESSSSISGRYSVQIGSEDRSGVLVLDVRGSRVRGAIGPTDQSPPFENGSIDGTTVTFTTGRAPIRWRLHFGGPTIEGEWRRGDEVVPLSVKRIDDLRTEDRLRLLPLLHYEDTANRSPRIVALREQLDTGEPGAVNAFWAAVAAQGTPLVEAIPGTDDAFLVTFVWRGTPATRNVLLIRGRFTFQHPPQNHLFAHIENTDVWFKTLRLSAGARLTYRLSENDPLGSLPVGNWARNERYDPLNPRKERNLPGVPETQWRSLMELPGASPQPWLRARKDVPTLALDRHRVSSTILHNERDVLVYTPPGYRTDGPPNPAVYLLDAEDPGGPIFSTHIVENLMHDGKIPAVIVVRIASPNLAARSAEQACRADFAAFLSQELVPFIAARYHVAGDPARTIIGGQSLSALAATCAGLMHPDRFGLLLVQSGSFWWAPGGGQTEPNWVAREFLRRPRLPLRFFLEAGHFEVDLAGRGGNILETTRHLRDVLIAKGYDVQYQEFVGDHEWVNWRGTLADGLIALLGPVQP